MSVNNAKRFIHIYQNEEKLRQYLMKLETPGEVRELLNELDLTFTDEEFEEAYNLGIVKCQNERQHNLLTQVKLSYVSLIKN